MKPSIINRIKSNWTLKRLGKVAMTVAFTLVIAIFLLLNGLFLWVFEGEYNILNSGFADLTPFFTVAPWVLIFLIPAVTMRSFSDI